MQHDALTYTVEEAAAAIGAGRDHVYALVRSGQIPHLRFGRKIRIPITGLHEWVDHESQRQAHERQAI